jgi:predicted hydrolase (HD superfamily)
MQITTLTDARQLMHDWTASPALRVHMEAVSAAVESYANLLDPSNAQRWAIAGLLHDFDYEKHPTEEEHPIVGVDHLRSLGVDDEICTAILAHAPRTGTPRDRPMSVALFACDELSGFIVACSKVRPDGLASLNASSVRKKLKDKAFAAAVSRDDIAVGTLELAALLNKQVTPEFESEHIQRCIEAIKVRLEQSR